MTSAAHMLGWLVVGFLGAHFGVSAWIDSSVTLFTIPPFAWAIPLIVAIALIVASWQVRVMAETGKKTMNGLTAARIAIFCQACSRSGMLLAGAGAGTWLAASGNQAVFLDEQANRAMWLGITSLAMGGAGWLGEWWCSIDDDDDTSAAPARA